MTELDFDELDKAVNDLMQDSGTAAAAQDDSAQPAPVAAQPTDDQQSLPNADTTPLAMKRRGRFMDVMAPAGGMKKLVVDTMVKRQGATIATPESTSESEDRTESEPQAPATDYQEQTDDQQPTDDSEEHGDDGSVDADNGFEHHDEPETVSDTEATQTENDGGYAANPVPAEEWPEAQEVTAPDSTPVESDNDDTEHAEAPGDAADLAQQDVQKSDEAVEDASTQPNETESFDVPVNKVATEPEHDEGLVTIINPDEQHDEASARDAQGVAPSETVMSSPFLPDAKVEKRPLGGGDQTSDETTEQPGVTQPEMPREYSSELMNLDSDTNTQQQDQAPQNNQPVAQAVQKDLPVSAVPTAAVAGATAGVIFDTDTYHAPLKPVKTKSGWLITIWVLVLLIIGSVTGAAYYYFTTQH